VSTPSARRSDVRVPVLALSVLGLGQAILVLITGHGVTRVVAVALAFAGVGVRLSVLSAFSALAAVNFAVHLAGLTPPFPYRIAHVSVLALYAAVALAGVTSMIPRVRFAAALLVASSIAFASVGAEAAIGWIAPPAALGSAVRWTGGPQSDPALGDAHTPYAKLQSVYPDNPRGYFDEMRTSSASAGFSVTYTLNALGCRGRDYPIPRPRERRRILILGGSNALGVGVREADTFSARLEQSLNAAVPAGSYEVVNCGGAGHSTREQRLFYEQIAFRYEPDLVLASVSDRDNLSRRDEVRLGYTHDPVRYEHLLLSLRLFRNVLHEGSRPFDYAGVAEELGKLNDACRVRDARLGVVLFGTAALSPYWTLLAQNVSEKFHGTNVAVLDLSAALLKDHSTADLMVHAIDPSPNEIAHRVAAEEIERLLRRQGWLRESSN
jgi:hypothetical protein